MLEYLKEEGAIAGQLSEDGAVEVFYSDEGRYQEIQDIDSP
jgi:hypothetical protein